MLRYLASVFLLAASLGVAITARASMSAPGPMASLGENRVWEISQPEQSHVGAEHDLTTELHLEKLDSSTAIASGCPLASRVAGPFGQVAKSVLEKAAVGGGSTTQVFTQLTMAPTAGRALSVSVGQNLANAARTGGQMFQGNIPNALITRLESIGLATRSTTLMNGVQATELRFAPAASEFVVNFFSKVP